MTTPAEITRLRKKPFVIDYTIHGSLHLMARDPFVASRRAEKLVKEATALVEDISVYCEQDISQPIDAEQRYKVKP